MLVHGISFAGAVVCCRGLSGLKLDLASSERQDAKRPVVATVIDGHRGIHREQSNLVLFNLGAGVTERARRTWIDG